MKFFNTLFLFFSIALLHAQSPAFDWVIQVGATSNDVAEAMATDAQGNVYTLCIFAGTLDVDPGPGVTTLTAVGSSDVFVLKLNANGDFVWAKQIGGSDADYGRAITVDDDGYIYSAGQFQDTVDFDPGPGVSNLISAGNEDVFIQKLDSNGNFVWAKTMGGSRSDLAYGITADAQGSLYTIGHFNNTVDFDPGPSVSNLTSNSSADVFIQKLDNNGNFVWVKQIGGNGSEYGQAITVDIHGNIYSIGRFATPVDFDPGVGINILTPTGGFDAFIQKLDANGDFVWVQTLSSSDRIRTEAIVTNAQGDIYTTGYFAGTVDFNPGTANFNLTSLGDNDMFLQKLDSNGNFLWARQMGGADNDYSLAHALDTQGNIYLTGYFQGTAEFDLGVSTTSLTAFGRDDIFIEKFDANGNFLWVQQIGGTEFDYGLNVSVTANNTVYTSGYFRGTIDVDPSTATLPLTAAGGFDLFVHKLSPSNVIAVPTVAPNTTPTIYPNPSPNLVTIALEQDQVATITILDNQGRLVHPPLLTNQQQTALELAHLPTGIYYISVTTLENTTVSKWTKL